MRRRFRVTPITYGAFYKFFLRCKNCGCILFKSDNASHKEWHKINGDIALSHELPEARIK